MTQSSPVTQALKNLLADSYVLSLKTQNYHWNVTGPNFHALHLMFETQYTELAVAIDEIAERIRALGEKAPGTFEAYSALTSINTPSVDADANAMVKDLLASHEAILKTIKTLQDVASENDDTPSEDLANDRLSVHEKTAWMLRATAE